MLHTGEKFFFLFCSGKFRPMGRSYSVQILVQYEDELIFPEQFNYVGLLFKVVISLSPEESKQKLVS